MSYATEKQQRYLTGLVRQCGRDAHPQDFALLSVSQAALLIDQLVGQVKRKFHRSAMPSIHQPPDPHPERCQGCWQCDIPDSAYGER